jgi:signal transduction histidine kinase
LRLVRVGPRSELAVALALLAAALAEQLARADTEHSPGACAWILAVWVPILVRRTHPAAGTCAAAAVIIAAPDPRGDFPPVILQILLPLVLSYSCGAHASTRGGLSATVALALAIQIHVGFAEAPNLEIAIATLPPWWIGRQVRRRRQLVRELTARTRELEAEEEAYIQLSVQRERARIARDLHDIVSHHLTLMVIQAGAGRLAEPWQADVAAARFATIRDAGVQALAEADRLVTMLQPDGTAPPRLAPLLKRAHSTGARIIVTPPHPALPSHIEAIAYRIVQEALTNAMKHAPGAAIEIHIGLGDGELAITVRNDTVTEASAIAHTGSGIGLAGMRERLTALGGSLDAGPEADGGFRVSARLPLDHTSGFGRESEALHAISRHGANPGGQGLEAH